MATQEVDEGRQRAVRPQYRPWAEGDYEPLLHRFRLGEIGANLVKRVGVAAGMDVLDVATGTGSAALSAASTGARVWGLDVTPEMLERAEELGAAAGLDVTWVHGDAEALPFADASFDRVVSSLGVMFVANHQRAADELVRVCRPGGMIGLCSWTPESVPGLVGQTMASYVHRGRAPAAVVRPLCWGTVEYVTELFADSGAVLQFERVSVPVELQSADAYIRILGEHSGPVVETKRLLAAQGRWENLCEGVGRLLEPSNETPGDGWTAPQEYLLAVAQIPAGPRAPTSSDQRFVKGSQKGGLSQAL